MSKRLCTLLALALVFVVGGVLAVSAKDWYLPSPIAICLGDDDCAVEEFCLKQLGNCDGFGECVNRLPEVVQCLAVWDPVCGCDGQTYSNGCYAHQAGVSIDHYGECTRTCFDNEDCSPGQFCAKPLGECDAEGECIDRLPDIVQCFAVWDPVCGCDGQTYSNGCYAQKAAANIDYLGECGAEPDDEPVEAVPLAK